jgi:hypothetical protein
VGHRHDCHADRYDLQLGIEMWQGEVCSFLLSETFKPALVALAVTGAGKLKT